jgi:hypothetical protein
MRQRDGSELFDVVGEKEQGSSKYKYACIHLALDKYMWIETTAAAADSRCLWGTRTVEALDAAIPSVGLRSRAARASAHK